MRYAWLKRRGACPEAVAWLRKQPGTPQQAWDRCPSGEWLLWILAECGADHPSIVRAACQCARLVLHLVPEGEDRPRLAIEAAESWAANPTDAAWAASMAAAEAAARAASMAAARAAWAARAAAWAARAAVGAARAAVRAAAGAAWAARAARAASECECADAVRSVFPEPPPEVLRAYGGDT